MAFVDEFMAGEFLRLLGSKKLAQKKRGPRASERLGKLGFQIERSFARLLDFVETHEVNEVGPLALFEVDEVLARDENALDFLMAQPFRIDGALLNAYPLGVTGSGDFWLVSLAPTRGRHEVFLLSHDANELELVADSVEALALAAHLTERGTPPTRLEKSALVGHVKRTDDLDLDWLGSKALAKPTSPVPRLHEHAEDLRSTLNDYSERMPAASAKVPAHPLPAEALDALLRAFLRCEDELLRELLRRFRSSHSGLVRDTAAYLGKLAQKGGPASFERRRSHLLTPARKRAQAELKKREAQQEKIRQEEQRAEAAATKAGGKARKFQERGDQRKAVAYFKTALAHTPKDGELWASYCYSLFCLERWTEMRNAAEQAVTFDEESSYAHQQLACACAGLEDYDGAIRAGRRAIELDPKNAFAMYGLATALLMKGMAEGRSLLKRAIRLNAEFREDAKNDPEIQKALAALE